MSLNANPNRRHIPWILGAALAIAGIAAFTALFAPGSSSTPANAQEQDLRCDPDKFGLLCLRKDTGGTPGTFVFDLERDLRPVPRSQDVSCEFGTTSEEADETEVLQAGEEIGLIFGCEIRVTERPQAGWELVRIDCDYNPLYYDVRTEGRTLIILLDQGSFDSVNNNGRHDIGCTFVNREVRPNLGAGLGGLFAGQPTPLPTARPAAVAPAATAPSISPPRTGDAGLR